MIWPYVLVVVLIVVGVHVWWGWDVLRERRTTACAAIERVRVKLLADVSTDVVRTTAKAEETTMGIFLTVLQYAFALLPAIVTGVQSVVGDTQSGATKKTMATDALSAALQGAAGVTTGTNATLAQLAGAAALAVIATTDAISTAVTHTKATGAYQAATATAVTAQAAITAASAPAAGTAQAAS
jgi:hypothetical protein